MKQAEFMLIEILIFVFLKFTDHIVQLRIVPYENRTLTEDDYVFRRHGLQLPMTPNSFTWRMKLILKKNGLPEKLNVHSLRHPYVKLTTKNFACA